ncbi:hypothetical protein NMG60_11023750 [Bertholletia excelsa]
MKAILLPAAVVTAAVLLAAIPSQAITCGQVDFQLAPCLPYLVQGGNPGAKCCEGVKNLKEMTVTTTDKRTACSCAKEAASRHLDIKEDNAAVLAAKCGVDLSVPISKAIDCAA